MYNSSKDLVSIPKQADGVGSFSQIEQDILYPENTLAILNGDSKNVISVSPKGEVTYIFTDTPSPKHRGKFNNSQRLKTYGMHTIFVPFGKI